MAEENLIYQIYVADNTDYEITVRVGDANPGNHRGSGSIQIVTPPQPNVEEWQCPLGKGIDIRGKELDVISTTKSLNPDSEWVSVRVFINGKMIDPISGNNKLIVTKNTIVYFNQFIKFV